MSTTAASSAVLTPGTSGSARASESGIWIALFAITMSFAAFTSALFIRQASSDWTHISAPPILFDNTLLLVLSSFLFEMSRRDLRPGAGDSIATSWKVWVFSAATLVLGLAFVGGQYLAWRQLAAQGLYLATNPNSSFFYLFTGMHALHVLGGIAALAYLLLHLAVRKSVRRNLLNGVATYWHFMGALWLYLLIVICTRL